MSEQGEKQFEQCAACGHVQQSHTENCTVERCSCPAFVAPGPGEQSCPSRMQQIGPWERKENLDRWETSRWGPYYQAKWPQGFEQPRTCSFCGGVHPDDAVKLLQAGWEVEATGKSYKRYLEPPGYHAHVESMISGLRNKEEVQPSVFVSPVPPVKLYVEHFSSDQVQQFNAVLNDRAASKPNDQ